MDLSRTTETLVALRSDLTGERDSAWRALYRQSFDRIYRLVCRYGIPAADVEDIVQQTFVIAHRRLGETDDIRNLGAWLCGIAARVASDHFKWRRVRRIKRGLVEAAFGVARSEPPSPRGSVESLEAQRLVGEVLARMSPKLRDVLVLTDIDGNEVGEVADILGAPVNTVRSRRQRARAQFAELWQRHVDRGASGA